MTPAQFAHEVVQKLRHAGHQALWAGGCVRDRLLGLEPHDYDVATDARPNQVMGLFRRTFQVGASFGVVEVLGPKVEGEYLKVQVATFRVEGPYSDGRRPDRVEFATAEADALRRDFTINGMFYDPIDQRVIDFVGGQADLERRILRAIGNPEERFQEDKLRLLRAVRFAARFGLEIDPLTFAAIRQMAEQIKVVSAERITDEFRKMLTDEQRARAMDLFWECGLAPPLLPEIVPMKGLPQGLPHAPTGDLWDHVIRVLARLQAPSFPLAFAALLHDVGKPRTVVRTADKYTFHHHEHVGKRMAAAIGARFKLANAERERVVWLVEKHQYLCDVWRLSTSKLKVILAHPGIRELLDLHRADAEATGNSTAHVEYCEKLLEEWSAAEINPPPLLTGHDLIRIGLTQGPIFRELLDRVREAQLDGLVKTSREALQLVEQIMSAGGPAPRASNGDVVAGSE